jgi:hypothetical protein
MLRMWSESGKKIENKKSPICDDFGVLCGCCIGMATSHESQETPNLGLEAIGLTEIAGRNGTGNTSKIGTASDGYSESTLLNSIENFEKERLAERSKQVSVILKPGLYMMCASVTSTSLLLSISALLKEEMSIVVYNGIFMA